MNINDINTYQILFNYGSAKHNNIKEILLEKRCENVPGKKERGEREETKERRGVYIFLTKKIRDLFRFICGITSSLYGVPWNLFA